MVENWKALVFIVILKSYAEMDLRLCQTFFEEIITNCKCQPHKMVKHTLTVRRQQQIVLRIV